MGSFFLVFFLIVIKKTQIGTTYYNFVRLYDGKNEKPE